MPTPADAKLPVKHVMLGTLHSGQEEAAATVEADDSGEGIDVDPCILSCMIFGAEGHTGRKRSSRLVGRGGEIQWRERTRVLGQDDAVEKARRNGTAGGSIHRGLSIGRINKGLRGISFPLYFHTFTSPLRAWL